MLFVDQKSWDVWTVLFSALGAYKTSRLFIFRITNPWLSVFLCGITRTLLFYQAKWFCFPFFRAYTENQANKQITGSQFNENFLMTVVKHVFLLLLSGQSKVFYLSDSLYENGTISHHFVTDIYIYLIFFQIILCIQFLCSTNPDQFSRFFTSNSVTPWTAACQASLSITNSGAYSNSCPLSQWCHPTISSSVVCFSSCPQSFPAPGSFQMSQLFASGGQRIRASASASVLPMNTQDWFPFRMDWLDLPAVQGTLKSLLQHHSSKASILQHSAFFRVQLSHPYMTTGKTIALTRQTFVDKVMPLLFNMLSSD